MSGFSRGVLQCLGRSVNHDRVLDACTRRSSLTCAEVQVETGIPRSTASRILRELEEQRLVSKTSRQYEVTPLGVLIAKRLESMRDAVEATQRLQRVLTMLSVDEFDFAVDQARYEILTPRGSDPGAPARRFADLLHTASHVRLLLPALNPAIIGEDALRGKTIRTLEIVIPCLIRDATHDDSTTVQHRQENLWDRLGTVFASDGDGCLFAGTIDETAVLGLINDAGRIHGYVETSDSGVWAWATTIFESHQQDAVSISIGIPILDG